VKQFRVEDDYRPVGWIGNVPVHVTTLLVAGHAAAMVVSAFLGGAGLDRMIFTPEGVWERHTFWTPLTYAFLHSPSLGFVLGMLMLFWFGREVERFLGRTRYAALYAALILVPPLVLLMIPPLANGSLAGAWLAHFGVFAAFAMLYPRAELFFSLQARWVALVIGGITLLEAIYARSGTQLLAFSATLATAWCGLNLAGFVIWPLGRELPKLRGRPVLTVLATPKPRKRPRASAPPEDPEAAINQLLDKISRDGFASLSAAERAELGRLREALLSKERV